jgi:hypothetical protein
LNSEKSLRKLDKVQDDNIALRSTCDHLSTDIDVLVDSILSIDSGKVLGAENVAAISEVLVKHRPDSLPLKG